MEAYAVLEGENIAGLIDAAAAGSAEHLQNFIRLNGVFDASRR